MKHDSIPYLVAHVGSELLCLLREDISRLIIHVSESLITAIGLLAYDEKSSACPLQVFDETVALSCSRRW